jgi:6-pyruvoyl-tetrahydropterin synthase
MAELEKHDIERKRKQKAIEESLKTQEVFISSETQIEIEKQIQESLIFIEDLNQIILEKKETIESLEFDIINTVEKLKNLKTELSHNLQWAKLMDKLDQLKKKKSIKP